MVFGYVLLIISNDLSFYKPADVMIFHSYDIAKK